MPPASDGTVGAKDLVREVVGIMLHAVNFDACSEAKRVAFSLREKMAGLAKYPDDFSPDARPAPLSSRGARRLHGLNPGRVQHNKFPFRRQFIGSVNRGQCCGPKARASSAQVGVRRTEAWVPTRHSSFFSAACKVALRRVPESRPFRPQNRERSNSRHPCLRPSDSDLG